MTTVPTTMNSFIEPLATIWAAPLRGIPVEQAARVVRRIVDSETLDCRLDVAAFNSAL